MMKKTKAARLKSKKAAMKPPFETVELRRKLSDFFNQEIIINEETGEKRRLRSFKYGVYAFYDYDDEPIYVGQTRENLGARVGRHLTNQRTDAVAMNVLDPFEVCRIEVWPLPAFEGRKATEEEVKDHLNALEFEVFSQALKASKFKAVLNEKDPTPSHKIITRPASYTSVIVSDEVYKIRNHPDTRIARRAFTLARLAQVISERQVQPGLRKTLLTQAKRLEWLADKRLSDFTLTED